MRVLVCVFSRDSQQSPYANTVLQKRHMQNSNNVHTELQAIVELVMEELETTKQDLEATQQDLEATQQDLETAHQDLDTTQQNLQATKDELGATNTTLYQREKSVYTLEYRLAVSEKTLESLQDASKVDEVTIRDLKYSLQKEKKRADTNSGAIATLEHLKSQWSTMSSILSDNSSAKTNSSTVAKSPYVWPLIASERVPRKLRLGSS